jgi:NAD(P)-dependent dehydrogenase (short-subunit alcohol dehydrogenase family)
MSELRLDGQVAIVTGSGNGIGRGIVMKLAQRGAKVVVNDYHPSGEGPEVGVVEEIRALGGEAVGVNASVTEQEGAKAIIDRAIAAFGRLDILVNNAGISSGTNIPCPPDAMFDDQIAIHVHGQMRTVYEAWPHLVKSAGRILNVGSMAGTGSDTAHGWNSAYPTAKSAVFGLTRQMAGRGAEVGIKVNALLPRALTPLKYRRIAGTKLLEWQEKHLKMEPLAASVVFMVHPNFPATGQFFSSCGGRVGRLIFATPDGYFNPDLTPEDVRDNWDKVWGQQDAEGYVSGMYEVTNQMDESRQLEKLYLEWGADSR